MSEIRGLIIQSRMDYLESIAKNHFYKQVFKKLPEPTQHVIGEQIFLTNMYPFHFLKEIDTIIAKTVNKSQKEIFKEMGELFSQKFLDRYFFNYLESQTPQKFLAQLANLYAYLWNLGKYNYQKISDRGALVNFRGEEKVYKDYCLFLGAFLKKGIELCGGKNVQIIEKDCGNEECPACGFEVTWE